MRYSIIYYILVVVATFSILYLSTVKQICKTSICTRPPITTSSCVTDQCLLAFNTCKIPLSGFKAWNDGVVTVVKPVNLQRNCSKIFSGDKEEIKKVVTLSARWKNALPDKELLKKTENCSWVREYFKDNLYVTNLERTFPIAFTFIVYERPQQVMRLLKFLYRPHNTYCIHPDRKSDSTFSSIFINTAKCLDNVHIASKRESVYWGHFSLMESQMNCLSDLVHIRDSQREQEKWKYVINLCGKELPLTTNHEMVFRLSKLNGSSAIPAHKVNPHDRESMKRLRHRTIPLNLPYYKSMTYMGVSYDFAHYLLTDPMAMKVRNFFKGCRIPEEHFYATLYMKPGVPGGFNPKLPKKLYFGIDQYFWLNKRYHYPCSGKNIHSICVVAAGDLKRIIEASNNGRKALFHNKYFMELDHTNMDCMEERLVSRNKKEYENDCTPHSKVIS